MNRMILKKIQVEGAITENTYFYVSEKSKSGVIIDPGAEASKLLDIVYKNGWNIEKILITHGHFDHIGAVEEIHRALKIPYCIHKNGEKYLKNPRYNFSGYYRPRIILNEAEYFEDGAVVMDLKEEKEGKESSRNSCYENSAEIDSTKNEAASRYDGTKLIAMHTPGHSSDSSIFYDEYNGIAFVGDTIFKGTIGATHFPGGSHEDMLHSIFDRIFKLPENTRLYSGHSEVTTVKDERINIGPWIIH